MKEFSSLDELETFIEEYQRRNRVQLWKRDARYLDSMRKVCPLKLKDCNSELIYYSLTYSCSKGGRKFEPKGSGLRNSSTVKENCNMHIKFKLSPDAQKLQIASIDENHSHITEKLKIRHIEAESYEPKKKRALRGTKNSSNMQVLKTLNSLKRNDQFSTLEKVFIFLNVDENIVHIAVNDDNKLLGIYFQTQWMKKCFAAYPELIIFEIVYKLNHLGMLVYVMMSVNGNNEGDPIAIFVINEEGDIISHMMQVFKEQNPKWSLIETIITDQDFDVDSVIQKEFPNTSHEKSMFHAFKRFREDVSSHCMGIDSEEREKCLEIFQKIALAKSIHEYCRLYEELMSLNIENVSDYYDNYWHGIREQWVDCYRNKNLIFGVTLANHIKSLQDKFKNISNNFDNLVCFFENLNTLLNNLKLERYQTADSMVLYNQSVYKMRTYLLNYMKLVTPHTFELIKKHLHNITKFSITRHHNHFKVISQGYSKEEYKVNVETNKCTCPFHTANYLPCLHIFAIKVYVKRKLYDEKLVHKRHLSSKYIDTFKKSSDEHLISQNRNQNLTSDMKYRTTITKCKKLASILAKTNTVNYLLYSKQLDTLIEHWGSGNKPQIIFDDLENAEDMVKKEKVCRENHQPMGKLMDNTEESETEIVAEIDNTIDGDGLSLQKVELEEVIEERQELTEEILEEAQISEEIEGLDKNDFQSSKYYEDKNYPDSISLSMRKRREEQDLTTGEMKKCKKI